MAAIVDDAIASFRRYRFATCRSHRRLFREAEEWLMSTDDRWLLSFEHICLVLGIDADRVRCELLGAC